MVGRGKGWLTAEYNMLPGSTAPRKPRDRAGKIDGRSTEIQRLIGRSLRAAVDLAGLGERTITVDCDVLEADGGTRAAAITGGYVAVVLALRALGGSAPTAPPIHDSVAALSVGIIAGVPTLDLDYSQDVEAEVDMNVVMTGGGRFVELQGAGEKATFGSDELERLLSLARNGLAELAKLQADALRK
jgi:ribonuclease PH